MAVQIGDTVLYKLTADDVDELNRMLVDVQKIYPRWYVGVRLVFGIGRTLLPFPMYVTSINIDDSINGRVVHEGAINPYWVHDISFGTGPGQYTIKGT